MLQRIRLSRWGLPVGIGAGAVTAGVVYALAPLAANASTRMILPITTSCALSHGNELYLDRAPTSTAGRTGHSARVQSTNS